MKNFILNTSFHINRKHVPQFIDWAKNTYIPQALNSGLFSNPLFTHLLIEVEPNTDSFAIHLKTKDIEKAILASNLGYNPGNDGETIRIIIPELTEERRRELVKQVKALAEEAKVAIRNIRREGLEDVSKLEVSEDEEKGLEKDIQDIVNEYNKKVEAKLKEKEEELLTV